MVSDRTEIPYSMFEIQPRIYLSRFPQNIPAEVTHVLNMCTQPHPRDESRTYLQVPIYDFDNITPYIENLVTFINNPMQVNGIVLVHCAMGLNRSAAAVLSYLCSIKPIRSSEALVIVKKIKPDVNPSAVFLRQIDLFYGRSEHDEDPLTTFHRRLQERKAKAGVQ